jgi:chitinase
MQNKVVSSFAAVLSIWLAAGFYFNAFAQSYTVIDLGTPTTNTSDYSEAHGINSSGSVAGEWGDATQNAFLYQDGTNRTIVPDAVAYALNNSNVVVGEEGAFIQAFVYNGNFSHLGQLGTGEYSIAWAINNAGEIVGESTASATGSEVYGIWWHNGGKIDLGILPGGDYSSARGINDSNVIVGEASIISGSVTNIYAFIYSNNVMSRLSTPTLGGNASSAHAINNAGQIVGDSEISSGDTHAFLFSSSNVMTDLGTLGGNYSTASAINSAGAVVGYAQTAGGDYHGFLFNGSAMLDLNDLISPSSVCTNLISADGINDLGQITGSGYTPSGEYHAFLLIPNSTTTITLSSPTILTNGEFEMTIQGAASEKIAVQSSTNLFDWISVSTNTLATSSTNWVDDSSTNSSIRFYRALLVQ